MGKHFVTGHATGTLPDAATGAINLLGRNLGASRSLYLSEVWWYKDTVDPAQVLLYDLTATTAAPSSTALVYRLIGEYDRKQLYKEPFSGGGLIFQNGCVAAATGSTGVTTAGGAGYELG